MNKASRFNGETKLVELPHAKTWWLITSALVVALILGLGALQITRLLALPLAVLVFGITLAASLAPVVSWLQRWMPRLPATLIVYFVLVVLFGALIWIVAPSLSAQVQDFASRIPDLIERVRELINSWRGNLSGDSFTNTLFSQLSKLGPTLLRLPLSITSALLGMLLILFISFYILLEASEIQGFFLSLFVEEQRARIQEVSISMIQAMGGYIRGVVINGVIVGFLTFLGLLVLGIDFAVVFGVMAGLLELIPVVGPIIAALIIVALTLLQSPGQALAALIFMVVLQQVENNILVPNIMQSQTKISPLLSILALFAGGAVAGLLGALIAIPIAAALRVLVLQVVAPAVRRQTGAASTEGNPQ